MFSGAHVNTCLALLGNVATAGCENTKRKTSSCSLFTLDFGTICVCLSHLHLHKHSKFYQGEETITRLTSTRWTCRDSTKLSAGTSIFPSVASTLSSCCCKTNLSFILVEAKLAATAENVSERKKQEKRWLVTSAARPGVSSQLNDNVQLQSASGLHYASCEKALNFAVNFTKIITWKKAPFKIKLNSFQIIMKAEYKHAHRKSHGLLF